MHTRLTNFITTIKGMKSRDFLYVGLSILFCIIIAILFFLSAKFISHHINKVFAITNATPVSSLDIPRYTLVAEKLNFPPDASAEAENPLEKGPLMTSSTTKNTLTLLILNASSKPKVAASMAKILKEKNGFTNIVTGNEKTASTTTILAQKHNEAYASMILETVIKTYPTAHIMVTEKPGKYDIVVTLGTK